MIMRVNIHIYFNIIYCNNYIQCSNQLPIKNHVNIALLSEYRLEEDTFGKIKVPANKLWGAQTQRSI